jgi:hypothetical protein
VKPFTDESFRTETKNRIDNFCKGSVDYWCPKKKSNLYRENEFPWHKWVSTYHIYGSERYGTNYYGYLNGYANRYPPGKNQLFRVAKRCSKMFVPDIKPTFTPPIGGPGGPPRPRGPGGPPS